MQPPPRKVKVIQELRTVQQEQSGKLHTKHQHETELLEDIREFSLRRAAIEKSYSQALQKLAAQYLQKRGDGSTPELKEPSGTTNRTALYVWKTLLEETEKVAKARVTAAETVSQQVAESIKLQKNCRVNTLKKCEDLTKCWHEEINGTIRELAKAKKNYVEAEQIAQEARDKAAEAENKLERGTLKFFQSKTTLQRQTSKLSARRETLDKRAAHMRNEYMLTIAAANVHQQRYYSTDLPYVIDSLDGDIFERLKDYFSVFSTTEVEASTYSMTCFRKVLTNALMVNRDYHHNCFLLQNPVFTNTLQYRFKPIEKDKVQTLVIDQHEKLYLEKEARKWATQVARESKRTEDATAKLEQIKSRSTQLKGSDSSSDSGLGQEKEPDQSFDTVREEFRRAETSRCKAEAKLEVLRSAGIDVDQWLDSAYEAIIKEAETEAQKLKELNESQLSQGPDPANDTFKSMSAAYNSFDSFGDDDDIAGLNDTVDPGANSTPYPPAEPVKCVALYTYEAQREDELAIEEHDYLEIVEESEGDGWVKARKENGDTGYIPETYVQIQRNHHQPVTSTNSQQSEFSTSGMSQSLSDDCEVQAVMGDGMAGEGRNVIVIVKALYDFAGSSGEELTFPEGAIIKVFRKDENGVDDGYWEGEFNGRVGVFPSILVEEFGGISASDGAVEADVVAQETDHIKVSTAILMSSKLSPSLRRVAEKLAERLPPPKQCSAADNQQEDFSDDEEEESAGSPPAFDPPSFEPPSMPPPPLPVNIMSSLSLPTGIDPSRYRSASVGPLETSSDNCPSSSSTLPRSSSDRAIAASNSLKPARVAPPPPGSRAKRPLQQQISTTSSQGSSRYDDDLPVSIV